MEAVQTKEPFQNYFQPWCQTNMEILSANLELTWLIEELREWTRETEGEKQKGRDREDKRGKDREIRDK